MARDGQAPSREGGFAELLRLAGPVMLARVGVMTMGLTDAVVVGRYSARQLGYHALGWAPTSLVLTTGMGLLFGVQVLTARYVGEGRRHDTGAVLRRGLVYAFWLGTLSALALMLLGPEALRAIGLEPDLARGAGQVQRLFALSLPVTLMNVALSSYLEGLARPIPGFLAMVLANLVNLALNLWLVPGGFGVPALGAQGAALATLGSRTAVLLGLAAFVLSMKEARALGIFDKPPRDPAAEAEQRRIGYAAGASTFVEVGAFSSMTIIAGWLGGIAAAGWAIVLNVTALVFMGPMGLATATGVLVGRAYGAGDRAGVLRAARTGFIACIGLTLVVAVLVGLWAGAVAGFYTTDPMLRALVTGALTLCCLFFVADGLQVVAAQALRSRGDVWIPTATHTVSYALVMIPLGWALAHPAHLGLNGIVWAILVASLLSAGLLLGRFAVLARREL